ncbi:MAG: protein kinase [Defluviitaleaceae bacterium]|nr:protein kinase [Defluviitaleaceae bacterium]
MTALKTGAKLQSQHKRVYTVIRFIASGGQGEVYEVEDKASRSRYALKWYFKHSATPYQKKLIDRLISRGKPDDRFLWPLDMIEQKGLFGYVMDLRPTDYKSVLDLMKRRAEPTFAALCMAGINLADGYQSLHSQGLCYRDISFGNLFFNPVNGDVLICDNDNVTVNQDSDGGTEGTPRFIAPEIISRKQYPSTLTDLYSMAVLLFYMFMLHHPLEGAIEANIKCLDGKAMEKIYGKEPIFIWDPANNSNRPIPGYQDNAIIFWDIYPPYIRDLFTRAFTVGLKDPNKRIVEKQWKEVISQLRDSIMYCSYCSSENFYDLLKVKQNQNHHCWQCKGVISLPPRIKIGNQLIMLNHNTELFSHHIKGGFDFSTKIGKISKHPTRPGRWGLTNTGSDNWTLTKQNGESTTVMSGKTAPLQTDAKINFGPVEGIIH